MKKNNDLKNSEVTRMRSTSVMTKASKLGDDKEVTKGETMGQEVMENSLTDDSPGEEDNGQFYLVNCILIDNEQEIKEEYEDDVDQLVGKESQTDSFNMHCKAPLTVTELQSQT